MFSLCLNGSTAKLKLTSPACSGNDHEKHRCEPVFREEKIVGLASPVAPDCFGTRVQCAIAFFSKDARAASCTFHNHLEHVRGPDGRRLECGRQLGRGNVPGPGDTAVIKGLTGSGLVSLNSSGAGVLVGSLTTDSTTSLEVISGSLSLGVASSSTLGGPVTVQAGATLSVGSASSVTIWRWTNLDGQRHLELRHWRHVHAQRPLLLQSVATFRQR